MIKQHLGMDLIHNQAEMLADQYLKDLAMINEFIGPALENIVKQQGIELMYKCIEDSNFYGMAASGKGSRFIGINTYHTIRTRLFDLAHELWHLYDRKEEYVDTSQYTSSEIERAADHFAASLLLPNVKVTTLYKSYKEEGWSELAILFIIADLSYCPYMAVYWRFKELDLSIKQIDIALKEIKLISKPISAENDIENKFIMLRKTEGLADSPLDKPDKLNDFPSLRQLAKEPVDEKWYLH